MSTSGTGAPDGPTGHRLRPHPADLVVEAWGPSRTACLAEAVRGLVAAFADTEGVEPTRTVTVGLSGSDPDLLVAALEEVIYRLDATDVVPVGVTMAETDQGVTARFAMARAGAVETTGPAPKAVSLHDLAFGPSAEGWSCRVLVDV